MNETYVIEPLEFIFTDSFFRGLHTNTGLKCIVIKDINDAWKYAFEQNLSSGFKVWNDIIELERSRLRSNDEFQEAYKFVSDYLKTLQVNHSSNFLEYRKKKIKKTNNKLDDFIFSDARDDSFFVLSTIAINRYLNNYIVAMEKSLFEDANISISKAKIFSENDCNSADFWYHRDERMSLHKWKAVQIAQQNGGTAEEG